MEMNSSHVCVRRLFSLFRFSSKYKYILLHHPTYLFRNCRFRYFQYFPFLPKCTTLKSTHSSHLSCQLSWPSIPVITANWTAEHYRPWPPRHPAQYKYGTTPARRRRRLLSETSKSLTAVESFLRAPSSLTEIRSA